MRALLTVAAMTVLEAARRRLIVVLAVVTAILIVLTTWGFSRLGAADFGPVAGLRTLVISQLFIFIVFGFSGVLAFAAALVGAPSIGGEIESGIIAPLAARPLSRGVLLCGRWLGVCFLVVVYTVCACTVEVCAIDIACGYIAPDPIGLVLNLCLLGVIVSTLAVLMSTRLSTMAAGITALVGFFGAWVAGIAGAIGDVLGNGGLSAAGTVVHILLPTDVAWRGAVYAMEPPDVLIAATLAASRAGGGGNPFLAAAPPSSAQTMWAIAWVVLALSLAVVSFGRREL